MIQPYEVTQLEVIAPSEVILLMRSKAKSIILIMLLPSFGYSNGVRTNVFINLTFLPLFLLLTGTSSPLVRQLVYLPG